MSIFTEPKTVLIFNRRRKMVGIASSVNQCTNFIGVQAQTISLACIGKHVMCSNFYVRYLCPNIEINLKEHIGVLDLIQYDKMCGEERLYFPKKEDDRRRNYDTGKYAMTAEQIELERC